ncbi:MAG: hypothetical protein K2K16_03170 [Ruminococcus sp.]|nr:hypothetical protein [Ruminococcus sp.]
MNDIRLCYFRFRKPVNSRKFFRYRVKDLSGHSRNIHGLNNEVRYAVISNFRNYIGYERMFVWSSRTENYIYTYQKIQHIPDLSAKNAEIEFADETEISVSENPELYSALLEYRIYSNIFRLRKYDCHEEHHFYLAINTPPNSLRITMRRDFRVNVKVMPDGTAYIGLDVSTEYYTRWNIYDYMKHGRDVTGMEVKCLWQGYDKTYKILKVLDRNINVTGKSGFNLYDYWYRQAPYRLDGIDPDNTKTVIVLDSKHGESKYIPQSLVPVFRRETIASFDSRFSRDTDRLMKLPMYERLQIMLEFIHDLNAHTDGIIIPEPVTAGECGYTVCKAEMPLLSIGNNRKIRSAEKYKTFSDGFYRLPEEICISFMYMEEKINECRQATKVIIEYLTQGKINGIEDTWLKRPLLPAVFLKPSYPYRQNYDELMLKETAMKISGSKRTNFVICFVPMENDDNEYSGDKSEYDIFKKVFAEINMPSQMVSADFLKKLKTGNFKDIKSYLQNIALGILSKSGGVPWILSETFSDVDCFVGIDVGMQSKGIHYPACSVCFDGNGNLLGYYTTKKAQSGEKISTEILTEIFDSILIGYKERNGRYPEHIVIHRDGFSNESDEWYEKYFSGKSIIYDIVEVKKNISERILDLKNPNGKNPDSSVCVIKDNKALIVTTQRQASYGGAPQPLEIVHRHGNIPMNQIVSQIYTLSELHVGALQSTRLPITTYYADRICKADEYIPRGKVYDKLYFL